MSDAAGGPRALIALRGVGKAFEGGIVALDGF
jgi:hypothetical protein